MIDTAGAFRTALAMLGLLLLAAGLWALLIVPCLFLAGVL